MATDFTDVSNFGKTHTLSLNSTALHEIKIPTAAASVIIGSLTKQINYYSSGTDGGSPPASDYMFIPAGNVLSIPMGIGKGRSESLFITPDSGSSILVHILINQRY